METPRSLDQQLAAIRATAHGEYFFVALTELPAGLKPFALINEGDFLTAIVSTEQADLLPDQTQFIPFTRITCQVPTPLEEVGITSTVAQMLSTRSIPINIVAGFLHDHLFVPTDRANEAIAVLEDIAHQAQGWLPN